MAQAMAQLTGPWPEVMALQDYEVMVCRSSVTGEALLGRKELAARWRCSTFQARTIIERVQAQLGLGDEPDNASQPPANRQRIASQPPAYRQDTASVSPAYRQPIGHTNRLEAVISPAYRQDTASETPVKRQQTASVSPANRQDTASEPSCEADTASQPPAYRQPIGHTNRLEAEIPPAYRQDTAPHASARPPAPVSSSTSSLEQVLPMSRTKEGEGAGRGADAQLTEALPPGKPADPAKPRRAKREPAVATLAPKGLGTLASPVQPPSPSRPAQFMPAELDLMAPFQRRVAELFEQAADLAHRCGYVWTCSAQDIVSHVDHYLREHPELLALGHQAVLDTMQTWLSKIEARANGNPGTPEIPVSPKASLNTYLGNTVRFERDRKAAPPSRFGGAGSGFGGPGQPPKPSGRAIGPNHVGSYGQPPPPAPAAPESEAKTDWSDKQDVIARMRADHEARKAAKAKAEADEKARRSTVQ